MSRWIDKFRSNEMRIECICGKHNKDQSWLSEVSKGGMDEKVRFLTKKTHKNILEL